jgi:hypothetical protein
VTRSLARAAGLLAWAAAPAGAEAILPSDLDRLPAAEVVILGEVHDNPEHHANQARALAAIRPRAVVFEMLTPEQAARVTPDLIRNPAALGAALGWEAAGWPDFALYAPLFAAVPGALIRGGAVLPDRMQTARAEGAAAAFGPGAARFGLDRALDPDDQAQREADMQQAHCDALPADSLAGFVAVQRLRDASLAAAALQALADTSGGPVAVIAGNGHARQDTGIPEALARAAPGTAVLAVGQLESPPGAGAPFARWLVTGAPDRSAQPDPCAALTGTATAGG